VIEDGYGDALVEDVAGDNLDAATHLDLLSLHARADGDWLHLAITIAGDVFDNPWGSYLVYFDTTQDARGADVDVGMRPITVADPYKPEFRLDIQAIDRRGTISGTYELHAWDGSEWQTITPTGGAAILNGAPSIIELQIPLSLLGDPDLINLAVVSTGRGRVHTTGDILGAEASPASWDEPVLLDSFFEVAIGD
jgi:hypothetical protein